MSTIAKNRQEVKGIFNFKELTTQFRDALDKLKEGVEFKIDQHKTVRAERRYEKIRNKLIASATEYSEKQINEYDNVIRETDSLTPVEKRKRLQTIANSKRKAATTGIVFTGVSLVTGAIETLAKEEASLEVLKHFTFKGMINNALEAFGIVAPPWTTIVAVAVQAGALAIGIYKLRKSFKFSQAEAEESNDALMESIKAMLADIKTLKDSVEKDRAIWIEKAKTMKRKDYEIAYAEYIDQKISELNLENLDRCLIQQVFGGKAQGKDNNNKAENNSENKQKRPQQESETIEQKDTGKEDAEKIENEQFSEVERKNLEETLGQLGG